MVIVVTGGTGPLGSESVKKLRMGEQEDWRTRAACRHVDPELFFPEGTAGPALEAANLAKRICSMCPVRARCLKWALDQGTAFGIWGGLDEGERQDLRHAHGEHPPRAATWPGGSGDAS